MRLNSAKGFITEDEANRITIFDLRTLKKTATAKTGNSPDGMIYDSSSKRVFVFSGDGKVTAVNAATGEVVGSAALGGSPEFAASDGRGHIYNNLEDKNEVVQIDSRNLRVLNRWSLAPGESPSGMAIDAVHHRLFVGCRNRKLVVMDSDTGKVVTTVPIGDGVDANRFDPATKIGIQLEWRWHSDGGPRGLSEHVLLGRQHSYKARGPDDGARSQDAPRLSGHRPTWPSTCATAYATTYGARNV